MALMAFCTGPGIHCTGWAIVVFGFVWFCVVPRTAITFIVRHRLKAEQIDPSYQGVEGTDFMTEGHQDAGLWKVPFASVNAGGNWLAIRSDCRILFRKVATRFSSALCC